MMGIVHEGVEAELCRRPSKDSYPCSNMMCAENCIERGHNSGYCKGYFPVLQTCMCTFECDIHFGGGGDDGGGGGRLVEPTIVPPHTRNRRAGNFA
jgi:hypothetical protein